MRWWKPAFIVIPIAIVGVASACGGSRPRISEIRVSPWPGGPGPVVSASRPQVGAYVPLRQVADQLPTSLPPVMHRPCRFGATVTVVASGRTLVYGPCALPTSVERLRRAIVHAAERDYPQVSARKRRGTSAWKAVLRDWYDGSMESWHSCAAVRAAITHIPSSTPSTTSIRRDLEAYANAVC